MKIDPHVEAFVAAAASEGRANPSWVAEEKRTMPPNLAALVDAIAAGPRLGQWRFELRDPASARELLQRAKAERKHGRWIGLAEGELHVLVAGWEPNDRSRDATVYGVDPTDGNLHRHGSLRSFIRAVLQDAEADDPTGMIARVRELLPKAEPSALELTPATEREWSAEQLTPPEPVCKKLQTKQHQRWLWHRDANVLVSSFRAGIRFVLGGKAKTVKHDQIGDAAAALGPDGSYVVMAVSRKLVRVELSSGERSDFELGHQHHFSGIGILPDHTLVLGSTQDRRNRIGQRAKVGLLALARWNGSAYEPAGTLEHELLQPHPELLGDAEMPCVLVRCWPNPSTLVCKLVDGKPALEGSTPHEVDELKRTAGGWLLRGRGGVSRLTLDG